MSGWHFSGRLGLTDFHGANPSFDPQQAAGRLKNFGDSFLKSRFSVTLSAVITILSVLEGTRRGLDPSGGPTLLLLEEECLQTVFQTFGEDIFGFM